MKIEQEIMEMFDEEFKDETYLNEKALGGTKLNKDIKSFISHIITLVQNDCKQNNSENI